MAEYVSLSNRTESRPEETLLIEWSKGEPEPTKYWLASVNKNISFRALVDLAKCVGRSSATTWSSSKKSVSGTTRGADGQASTITEPFASRHTDS